MRSNKELINCKSKGDLGNMWWSFLNERIFLLTLLTILLRYFWKSSLVFILKCFWVIDCDIMLLLKINEGWDDFWILREKITSWDCLLGCGLRLVFHWKAQLFILFKSSFKLFADKSLSNITEKRDVTSGKSLGFKTKFSDKLLKYIKKSSGLRIELWGTLASTLTHVEFWPCRTTLGFLPFRKFA